MEQITSIEHLKKVAYKENGDFVEFCLLLAGGIAKSSKRISYRPNEKKQWLIVNEIDDSYQELLDKSLSRRTRIPKGIVNGAFFLSDIS